MYYNSIMLLMATTFVLILANNINMIYIPQFVNPQTTKVILENKDRKT